MDESKALTLLPAIPEEEIRQRLPGYYDHIGRPMKYPAEVVEAALYEVAAGGGNVAGACRRLHERGITQNYPDDGPALSRDCVRGWVKRRFRNRYHEIQHTHVRELEEQVARNGIDLALRGHEAKLAALQQTTAGLADASAIEASTILRNIAQAEKLATDQALTLRGRGPSDKVERSLDEIAKTLKSLGLVQDEEPVDAEVVEDG